MKGSLAGLLVLLCLQAGAAAQEGGPEVRARLDRDEAVAGDRVLAILEVVGEQGADCFLSRIPEIPGARVEKVEGPAFSLAPRDGDGTERSGTVLVTRFEITLIPLEAGTLSIPPLEVSVQRGRKFLGPPLTLEVRSGAPPVEGVALVVEPLHTPVYRFEPLRIRVVLTLEDHTFRVIEGAREGALLSLPWLEREPSFLAVTAASPAADRARWAVPLLETASSLPCSLEVISEGDRRICRLEGEVSYLPARTGFFTLPGSVFSFAVSGSEPLLLKCPAFEVEVRPLPEAGRPAPFTNGVGRFAVRFDARPREVQVGEALRLTFEVEGKGNLAFLEMPVFSVLERGFRLFGTEDSEGKGMRGRTYLIAPRSQQVKEIPELAFSYFDPEDGAYRTERWGPLPITVRTGGVRTLGGEPFSGGLEEIETIAEEPGDAGGGAFLRYLTVAALVLSAAFLVRSAGAARGQRAGTEAAERARKALAAFRAACGEGGDPDGLAAGFRRFLAHRFRLSPSEAMAGSCGPRLAERGVARELAREADRLLERLDALRFAPDGGAPGSDPEPGGRPAGPDEEEANRPSDPHEVSRSTRDLAERALSLAARLDREEEP